VIWGEMKLSKVFESLREEYIERECVRVRERDTKSGCRERD
jgi:hypothetical protein